MRSRPWPPHSSFAYCRDQQRSHAKRGPPNHLQFQVPALSASSHIIQRHPWSFLRCLLSRTTQPSSRNRKFILPRRTTNCRDRSLSFGLNITKSMSPPDHNRYPRRCCRIHYNSSQPGPNVQPLSHLRLTTIKSEVGQNQNTVVVNRESSPHIEEDWEDPSSSSSSSSNLTLNSLFFLKV